MPRYLLVAHQTASSEELTQAVREIVQRSPDAEFVLVVPETPIEELLDWQDGDANSVAKRVGEAAKTQLNAVGANVVRISIGDPSPIKAIEDELAKFSEQFDGLILSTLPLQRSRWLMLDQPRRIERRFRIPVTHVIGRSVTMSRVDLIRGLNEDLNLELETILRGVAHAAVGRGMLGHELRELLKSELPGELEHAMFLADKIVSLGRRGRDPTSSAAKGRQSAAAASGEHRRREEGNRWLHPENRPGH
jgi:GABA permease